MDATAERAPKRAPAHKRAIQSPADELAEMKAYVATITSSKENSVAFLKRAGILDRKGELAKPYRA